MSALLLTSAGLAAPTAAVAETRSLCARTANLRDTPNGFVIGRLTRPQRLTILRRSQNRRWIAVRISTGLAGWLPAGSVCRRGR